MLKVTWADGTRTKKNGALTITTDDHGLVAAYSYETCLAVRAADGSVIFNATWYTKTTSRHQDRIHDLFDGQPCVFLYGVPRGSGEAVLRARAARDLRVA